MFSNSSRAAEASRLYSLYIGFVVELVSTISIVDNRIKNVTFTLKLSYISLA